MRTNFILREGERGASYTLVKRTHITGSLGKIKFKLCEIIIILNEFLKFCTLGIKMAYWIEVLTSLNMETVIDILGCDAVYSDTSLPVFWRNVLPPISGQEASSKLSSWFLARLTLQDGECVLLTYRYTSIRLHYIAFKSSG
jgi:hypothetical protein